jgi:four helix bundle protein
MATVNEFEELEIWKKARIIQKEVFKLTKNQFFSRDYRLVTQINDATDSVMGNISEGIERDGHKELMQFLSFAKGSAGEVRSHLWVAFDREYIEQKNFEELHGMCKEVSRMIGGFMRYLRNSDKRGRKYKKID